MRRCLRVRPGRGALAAQLVRIERSQIAMQAQLEELLTMAQEPEKVHVLTLDGALDDDLPEDVGSRITLDH